MASLFRDKQKAEVMKRAEKVYSYRLAGFTYRQISDKVGVGVDTVRKDFQRMTVEYPEQTARDLVAEQNQKLVEMMKPQYLKAITGNGPAAKTMLELLRHQADLFGLIGLNADDGGMDLAQKQFQMLVDAVTIKADVDQPGDH